MKKSVVLALALVVLTGALFANGADEEGEVILKFPTFWVAEDTKAPAIAAQVEAFNAANAGMYSVEIEPNTDIDGYRDKLNAGMASRVVPDLFVFNPDPTTFQFYESDLLFDFTDELAGSWGNDFVEGTVSGATRNGRTKSVPYEIAITPIWYNTDLFAKAGLSDFPETLDEFWDACDALVAAGVVPTSQMTGGSNAWTSMLWYSHLLASLGGPDVWEKELGDPIYEEAAAVMKVMYEKYTTKDAVGGDAGVSGGHFLSGNTAMFINGPWYIGRVRDQAPEVYAATQVAPGPKVPGGVFGAQIGFPLSNLSAANAEGKKADAVLAFMKHLTAPENVKEVSLQAGSLFAIKFEIGAGDQVDPLQAKFVEASTNANFIVGSFANKYDVAVVAQVGQALGAMALGQVDAAGFVEMLKAAQ